MWGRRIRGSGKGGEKDLIFGGVRNLIMEDSHGEGC